MCPVPSSVRGATHSQTQTNSQKFHPLPPPKVWHLEPPKTYQFANTIHSLPGGTQGAPLFVWLIGRADMDKGLAIVQLQKTLERLAGKPDKDPIWSSFKVWVVNPISSNKPTQTLTLISEDDRKETSLEAVK